MVEYKIGDYVELKSNCIVQLTKKPWTREYSLSSKESYAIETPKLYGIKILHKPKHNDPYKNLITDLLQTTGILKKDIKKKITKKEAMIYLL